MAARAGSKAAAGGGAQPTPMALWVGRARAVGALVGFAIAFWACRRAGLPAADAVLRSLVAAVALSLVAWWSALLVITALLRSAAAQREREIAEAMARAAATAEEVP